MNSVKKRCLSCLCLILAVCFALTACGQPGGASGVTTAAAPVTTAAATSAAGSTAAAEATTAAATATEAATTTAAATESAAAEMEPVTYIRMINGSYPELPADGGEAREYLKARWAEDLGITNTDYQVIAAQGDDYSTRLNTMLASDEIPDMFSLPSASMLPTMVENGLIASVDSFIDKMPNYLAYIDLNETNRRTFDNYMIDGVHYGLADMLADDPNVGPNTDGLMIRMDWLEKLSLEVPTTLDELHEVLRAFTFNDPDGNGQNDTYGMGGQSDRVLRTVFGAYGIPMLAVNSWVEVNGQLEHSTVQPGAKDALATMAEWYAEGLIDPDTFIVEAKQAKEKFIGGITGTYEYSIWWAEDARLAWANSAPDAKVAMLPPPTGPGGLKGNPANPVRGTNYVSQNCADNKDIDRLAKILNWVVDMGENGGMRTVCYGIEGTHYTYDAATNFTDQSLINGEYSKLYAAGFSNPVRWIGIEEWSWMSPDDERLSDSNMLNRPENLLFTAFSGTVPAIQEYPDLYDILWLEYYTKIITGALPVSAHDEYVAEFAEQGGTELTEQVNAARG